MAYKCEVGQAFLSLFKAILSKKRMQVGQEKLIRYIHFNRHYNTLLIEHNTKLIKQLRTEMENFKPGQSKQKNY